MYILTTRIYTNLHTVFTLLVACATIFSKHRKPRATIGDCAINGGCALNRIYGFFNHNRTFGLRNTMIVWLRFVLLHKGADENSSYHRISRKGVYFLHLRNINTRKNLQCLNSWKEILRFFDKFSKFYRNFSRQVRVTFLKFGVICILSKLWKSSSKTQWKLPNLLKIFMNYDRIFKLKC